MSTPLHVLWVEDSTDDVALLSRELYRGGYDVSGERVATATAMAAALDKQSWDIVLSDCSMPEFDALSALALMKGRGLDLPFIILSGVITDEAAVQALRAGAHDYVLKENLARFLPAVARELNDAALRRERATLRAQLESSERMASATSRQLFEATVAEERERRRIAIELHDRIGQSLVVAQMKLASIDVATQPGLRATITGIMDLVQGAATAVSTMMFELSPPGVYELGLGSSIRWLAEEMEGRFGQKVAVHDDENPKEMAEVTSAVVFRSVRELLMNAFKHSNSLAATVSLARVGDTVQVTVEDEGVGAAMHETARRRTGSGFGLVSIREQIQGIGGTLDISSKLGHGTRVQLAVPAKSRVAS